MTGQVGIGLFAVIWNQVQNQTTPAIHLRILSWLENAWTGGQTQLLLMAFRACGKSTLVGIFAAWVLYCNPNIRIMVLAADSSLARKMVRNVKRMIERHPLTAHLRPERVDQWAGDRFTINRPSELRDPSMLAGGITSNITGARADMIICDDVEVPNTSATIEKRHDLRDRLSEARFILTAGGTQLYVGTPHHYDTIYATDQGQQNPDQGDAFLDGFYALKIPLLNEYGHSNWPEKFTDSDIAAMRKQVGPNRFASQMMLQPVNIAEGRLDPSLLQFYKGNLNYSEAQSKPVLRLNDKRLVSCSVWWDPSFGQAGGDASVIAFIFTDEDGHYYLHHIDYIRADRNAQDDEATQQCKQVATLCAQFFAPSVTVEINGIGRFLPAILRRELRRSGHYCAVIEHSSRTPKSIRIVEGFDAVMAARALSVNETVRATPFLNEMREWRPTSTKGHDDGLDAVAGALSQEPIRIAVRHNNGISQRHNWQGGGSTYQAKTQI